MAGKRGFEPPSRKETNTSTLSKDVEDRPQRDRMYRFRDSQPLDADDERRVEFKKLLLNGAEQGEELENFRKSDEEVYLSPVLQTKLNLLETNAQPSSSRKSSPKSFANSTKTKTRD